MVTFASAEVVLAGSLAVPDRVAASPGVVMVGGSGPTDRHNDTYFPPIRRHLVCTAGEAASRGRRAAGSAAPGSAAPGSAAPGSAAPGDVSNGPFGA